LLTVTFACGLVLPNHVFSADEKTSESSPDINVQLKLVTEKEWQSMIGTPLFEKNLAGRENAYYLVGMVTTTGSDMVNVTLEVYSPNNPTIRINDVQAGWVNRNVPPVYFVEYLGQPPLKTPYQEAQLKYKVVQVMRK